MNDYPLETNNQTSKKIYSDAIVIDNKKILGFASNVIVVF